MRSLTRRGSPPVRFACPGIIKAGVSKSALAVAISHCPHARHDGAQLIVNNDVATLIDWHPCFFKTEVIRFYIRIAFCAIDASCNFLPVDGHADTFRLALPHHLGLIGKLAAPL